MKTSLTTRGNQFSKKLKNNESGMIQLIKSSQKQPALDKFNFDFQSNINISQMLKSYKTSLKDGVQMNFSKKVSNQLKSMLLVLAIFIAGIGSVWGQTTIFSDLFNGTTDATSTTNFTGTGTITGYGGMSGVSASGTTNCPASTNYFSEGTKAYHVRYGDITLTSVNIDTRCMNGLTLSFKLAAFSNTNADGMDDGDYVEVSISPDGGTNYYPTIRVKGNANAKWLYSATGTATTAYDGDATLNSTVASAAGGNNCTSSVIANGPSTVSITNLPNSANMKIRIRLLNNATDERWLLDNLKVTRTTIISNPTISYAGSPLTYTQGTAISTLTPSTTNSPTTFAISPALPTGLSFSTTTGAISGTPTVSSATQTYTISATSANSCSNTTTISLSVKPSNDVCAGAISLSLNAAAVTGDISGALAGSGACSGTANYDVWYKFTPSCAVSHTVTATGSASLDAVFQVYSGSCASLTVLTPTSVNSGFTASSCNDYAGVGVADFGVYSLASGSTYYVRIYDFQSAGTAYPATTTFTVGVTGTTALSAASISGTSPQTICSNTSGSVLTASGTNGGTLSYAWGKRASTGGAITSLGVTTSTYTPASASLGIGTWFVVCTVSPTCGSSIISNEITVTVNQLSVAPTVLNVSVATICNGGNTTLTQTGGTLGTGAVWQWYSNANFTTTVGGTLSSSTASLSVSPTSNTTYYLRAINGNSPCAASIPATTPSTVSVMVTVNPTSVAGTVSANQTICSGQSPSNITLTGSTGNIQWQSSTTSSTAGFNDIVGAVSSTLTLGSLSTTAYYRAVVTSGLCTAVNSATGTITVTPSNTAGSASSTPTSCIYNAITNITHTTTGATGISNSGVAGANGLPSGIAASWASNTITISGTPWVSGTFNYAIPLTGGCGSVSATGTIIIKATPSGNFSYSNYGFCSSVNTSQAITSNFTDATGTFSAAAGLNLNTTTGGITPSLSSPNAYVVTYSIPASSGCPSYSTTTNVTIDPAGSGIITYNPSTICLNASGTVSPSITNAGGSGTPWFTVSPNGLNMNNSGVITPIGSTAGTYTITYNRPSSGLCSAYTNSTTVTLSALASSTAGAASSTPTLCINSALTNITHVTTGATGIGTAIGLPAGVTASWASNTITISGNPTTGGTYNYSIPLTGGCGAVNAIGSITVTQPSTTISVNGNTIGDGDYLWNGKLNTNANVKNNWYVLNNGIYSEASQAPQATDEVFVVSAADAVSCVSNSNNMSIPAAGNFNSSNMNIGASASVSLGNGASLNVKGDFINDGNFNAGSGTVVMNGTSLQKIKGTAATTTFKNLTINNSNGVKLENAVVVDSVLLLTNGLLDLGSKHLTIGTTALISGTPGNSKMIIASGMGELRKQFSAGTYNPASFTFPVGTSNGTNKYNPVVLDFLSGTFGSNAYVGVRVQDQKNALLHPDNTTYINKNWIVEPNGDVTAFNYNIKLYFNPAAIAQGGDFVTTSGQTIGDLLPIKYSGGQWYQPVDGTFTNALAQGIAGVIVTNYLSWDGLTTFSEFGGVGGSNNPLPVELLSFSGKCNEGMVNLAWQTASEFNSSHFDVEKSTDGETWRVLTTVPSAGTSNELLTYQAVDNNGTNGSNYYRLRQVDNDGKEKLYDPINVSCVETTAGYFTSYPNPSGNEFQVVVNNKEILGACTLNIVDAQGKVIDQRSIEVKEGINMFVISETLNPGIYFLNITNGTKTTQVIKHAIR